MPALSTFIVVFVAGGGEFNLRIIHAKDQEKALEMARGDIPDPTLPLSNIYQYDHSTIGTLFGLVYRPGHLTNKG